MNLKSIEQLEQEKNGSIRQNAHDQIKHATMIRLELRLVVVVINAVG